MTRRAQLRWRKRINRACRAYRYNVSPRYRDVPPNAARLLKADVMAAVLGRRPGSHVSREWALAWSRS